MKRKIYVASSWRNPMQPHVVQMLRMAGHEVYDFRNPPNKTGFAWSEIDHDWQNWTPAQHIAALSDPIAKEGFADDKAGLDWCDTCILLLPCGRSAHLEAGYAIGRDKHTFIVLDSNFEPELMYLLAGSTARIVPDLPGLMAALEASCDNCAKLEPNPSTDPECRACHPDTDPPSGWEGAK
jgi:hypothetical protein